MIRVSRCDVRGMGKKRDGVGTADCREMISGDWELGRERLLKRVELNDEKDFEIEFLASDLFWMNFTGVTSIQKTRERNND